MKMYKFNKGDGNGWDTIVTDFIELSQKADIELNLELRQYYSIVTGMSSKMKSKITDVLYHFSKHFVMVGKKKLALYYFWTKLESGKTLKLIENSCQTWLTWESIHQFLVNINEIDWAV